MTVDTRYERPSAADPSTLAMWRSLGTAVSEALERKRRLGQYWVEWTGSGPRIQQPADPAVPAEASQQD